MNKVTKILTDKFLEALNSDILPWRRDWVCRGFRNLVSKKPYRGFNILMLAMFGGSDSWFLTFKQINAMGGKLKKGTKGIPICFYSKLDSKTETLANGKPKGFMMMRYYLVFPASQVEDIQMPVEESFTHNPIEEAESLVARSTCPVKFGGNQPCYWPSLHEIGMTAKEQFKTAEGYYATFFHEIGHSLACETGGKLQENFGGTPYAFEELVAEIFASMCSNHCGILTDGLLENSQAYIKGWCAALKSNPEMIIKAAGQAQKRFDFLTGTTFNNAPDEE